MQDLEFIKSLSKITIKKICKKAHVSSSNLYAGRLSEEKINLVRKIFESEIAKLYIVRDDKNE